MRLWGLFLRRNSRLSDCRTRTMRPRGCLLGQNSRRLAVSDGSADRCDSELFPCSLTPNREGPPGLIQETAVKVNAPVFLVGSNSRLTWIGRDGNLMLARTDSQFSQPH